MTEYLVTVRVEIDRTLRIRAATEQLAGEAALEGLGAVEEQTEGAMELLFVDRAD